MAEKITKKRIVSLDILRTLSVIIAIWIHANQYLCLPGNSYTTEYVRKVAQIGYVFAFAGGYISALGYLKKFSNTPSKVTKKLLIKGLSLFGVIAVYVSVMSVINASSIDNIWSLLFFHGFMNRVLFIFALMYMALPLIYLVLTKIKHRETALVLAIILLVLGHVVRDQVSISTKWFIILFDHWNNLYPLIFMIAAYLMGIWWGQIGQRLSKSYLASKWKFILCASLVWLLIAFRHKLNYATGATFAGHIAIGSTTLAMLTFMLDALLDILPNWKLTHWLTLPGQQSLTFFVMGNAVVDIFYMSCDVPLTRRIFMMIVTMSTAYMFSLMWFIVKMKARQA